MGLFGKLKNILFEDDDEVEEMPVYTKEEVEEVKEEVLTAEPVQTEEIKPVEAPKLHNVKRDIDMTFEEDVLGEIPGAFDNIVPPTKEELPKEVVAPPVEEKKSIFPSFDEAEFERLNPRVNHNESKATQREMVRRVDMPVNNYTDVNARQANNNFSSTNVREEQRDPDRYKINTGTIVNGKKPFTPSPVISPVYGILDKNYTKEDIVDRKGGLKREKSNKLPIRKERTIEEAEKSLEEEEVVVSIDSVRKKAYGDEIELPKEHKREEHRKVSVEKEEVKKPSEEVYEEVAKEEIPVKIEEPKVREIPEVPDIEKVEEKPSIEDQIEEEKFEVEETPELDSVIEEVVPEAKDEKPEKKKMKVMDELEKTSTLKILDDIEKELNSIKPISKEAEEEEDADIKEHEKSLDDTLENDLFNLIDSMYEGDEEDDWFFTNSIADCNLYIVNYFVNSFNYSRN